MSSNLCLGLCESQSNPVKLKVLTAAAERLCKILFANISPDTPMQQWNMHQFGVQRSQDVLG